VELRAQRSVGFCQASRRFREPSVGHALCWLTTAKPTFDIVSRKPSVCPKVSLLSIRLAIVTTHRRQVLSFLCRNIQRSSHKHNPVQIAMSLAAPGLLPKAATPLRILAASRPSTQSYPERSQSTFQSRRLHTAPSTRSARHVPRQSTQARVSGTIIIVDSVANIP
jgi:hypothetical protein